MWLKVGAQMTLIAALSGSLNACASVNYPVSDHYDGKKFFQPEGQVVKGFWDLLKWQTGGNKAKWPEFRENKAQSRIASSLRPGEISTTYVNHATHLIQIHELNILTDPHFSKRASPYQWIGPKRVREPGVALDKLPKIDVILVSHNHYDHMDSGSIHKLTKAWNPLFIVPLGNAELVKGMGALKVVELDWWQSHKLPNANASVVLVPAQHWSSRGLTDRNKALWGGFVIQSAQKQIYFAGDTGYGAFFKTIRQRLGPMDLSIIPIGAYEPRWFMKEQHVNPEEAVLAHLDLDSKMTLGTHFGTFPLTNEGIDQPVTDLKEALLKHGVSEKSFVAPDNGETVFLD